MYASLFDTGSETVGQMSQENTSPKLKIDKQYKKSEKNECRYQNKGAKTPKSDAVQIILY